MPGQGFITYDIPLTNSDESYCFILRTFSVDTYVHNNGQQNLAVQSYNNL